MLYENFLKEVRSSVQEKLPSGTTVKLHRILKNNGVVQDGLSFTVPGISFAPTVYLNPYYEEMKDGLPLSVITEQILLLYEEQQFPAELECCLSDPDAIKDQVVYKLIGASGNEALLADVPHYRYLDLAVVFYLIVTEDTLGQMTALVHNEHLKLWDVTKEQLLKFAEKNTPLRLPARIRPIEEVIMESEMALDALELLDIPNELQEELTPVYLYVLTNQSGINGAACLLYPDVLKNFAEKEEDDLLILPSSIHEVLLAPAKKALSYSDLNEMVESINQSEVPTEDRLSGHIYRYSREQDCLLIPPTAFAEDGKPNPQ